MAFIGRKAQLVRAMGLIFEGLGFSSQYAQRKTCRSKFIQTLLVFIYNWSMYRYATSLCFGICVLLEGAMQTFFARGGHTATPNKKRGMTEPRTQRTRSRLVSRTRRETLFFAGRTAHAENKQLQDILTQQSCPQQSCPQ